jgi:hypothetical protein
MHFDFDHWKMSVLAFGSILQDPETGNMRWPMIAASISVAGIVGAVAVITTIKADISGISARQEIVLQRLDRLEGTLHPATSKRYTSDDAVRDLDLIRTRIRDAEEIARREDSEIKLRLQRLEDKLRR